MERSFAEAGPTFFGEIELEPGVSFETIYDSLSDSDSDSEES